MSYNPHHAHVYLNLESLLRDRVGPMLLKYRIKYERYWRRMWKKHVEKHGNVPLILKCAVCSGQEHKLDVKRGRWKPGRPSRVARMADV